MVMSRKHDILLTAQQNIHRVIHLTKITFSAYGVLRMHLKMI